MKTNRLILFENCAKYYNHDDRKILYPVIEAIYDETMGLAFFNNLTKKEAKELRKEILRARTLFTIYKLFMRSNVIVGSDFVVKIFDVAYMMSDEHALYYTAEGLCACLLDYANSISSDEEEEEDGKDEQ